MVRPTKIKKVDLKFWKKGDTFDDMDKKEIFYYFYFARYDSFLFPMMVEE